MNELLVVAGIQGLILAFALNKRYRLQQDGFNGLVVLIILVSAYLLIQGLLGSFSQWPKLFLLSYSLIYLFVPVYFLHVCQITQVRWNKTILFVPVVTYLVILIPYLSESSESLAMTTNSDFKSILVADVLSIAFGIYLLIQSRRLTIEHSKKKGLQNRVYLGFVLAMLIIHGLWLTAFMQWLGLFASLSLVTVPTIFLVMCFFIFVLGYFAVASKDLFFSEAHQTSSYKNVNYDALEIAAIADKILDFFEKEKGFLEPNFTLKQLADHISVDRFKTSYVINKQLNTNFNALLGKYRIREFLRLMSSDKYAHYSLAGVANEAGFKSKSTFYKAFREVTGKTPSEYFTSKEKELAPQKKLDVSN